MTWESPSEACSARIMQKTSMKFAPPYDANVNKSILIACGSFEHLKFNIKKKKKSARTVSEINIKWLICSHCVGVGFLRVLGYPPIDHKQTLGLFGDSKRVPMGWKGRSPVITLCSSTLLPSTFPHLPFLSWIDDYRQVTAAADETSRNVFSKGK